MNTTIASTEPGTRVRYRFWDSEDFHTGTVVGVWDGVCGTTYVDVKREGFSETAVLPLSKFQDPALVQADEFDYYTADGEGVTDFELGQRYRDHLDSLDEDGVLIAGLRYSTSRALEAVDPIAFHCGYSDWIDSELSDGNLTETPGV